MAIEFDFNWIDALSAITGVSYTYIKAYKAGCHRTIFPNRQFGNLFAVGCSIFPMIILIASFFFSGLLNELANSSRLTLAVSGIFALSALLESNANLLEQST